jgi:hypothetical protein
MTEALLAGIRVVDLAGEPAAMAGRILADLGAEVILVEPREGHPLRALTRRFLAWGAGKASLAVDGPDDPQLDELLATADAVIETPGFPGVFDLDPARAPGSVWARVTPFGGTGPHAGWRASDPCDGGEREHVRHRRSRPTARSMQRAGRLRTPAPRPRSPSSRHWRRAPRTASTSRCRRSSSSPTWWASRRSRRRVIGARGMRQHRPHP